VDIDDANYAEIERFAHWQAALRMAEARPWLGVGFGNYPEVYPDYALMNWPDPLGHAHNYYLNALAETGLVGLGAYLLMWAWVAALTVGVLRRPGAGCWARGVALGLLGAWTHLAIHSMLDKLYVNNAFLHVGVLLGVLAVLHAGKTGASSV
jgi:O-antigen ligase